MVDIPRATPLPLNPVQPSMGGQLAEGIVAGTKLNQGQQQLDLEKQRQQFEKGVALAHNALEAYDHYGDVMGPESLEAFKKGMNMVAPGSVNPDLKWDDSMSGHMGDFKSAMDAAIAGKRPWAEALGVMSKIQATAGKMQREKMQSMMDTAKDIYGQEQTVARQKMTQGLETQRAYAEHAQPIIQAGSQLSTTADLLSKKDPTSDALAKANIEKLVANGTISQHDIDQMTSSGGPFEKAVQKGKNWWTGLTFDDTHRQAMQAWIQSKAGELNKTLQSTATAFPGAAPASIFLPRVRIATDPKTKKSQSYIQREKDGPWLPQ